MRRGRLSVSYLPCPFEDMDSLLTMPLLPPHTAPGTQQGLAVGQQNGSRATRLPPSACCRRCRLPRRRQLAQHPSAPHGTRVEQLITPMYFFIPAAAMRFDAPLADGRPRASAGAAAVRQRAII